MHPPTRAPANSFTTALICLVRRAATDRWTWSVSGGEEDALKAARCPPRPASHSSARPQWTLTGTAQGDPA